MTPTNARGCKAYSNARCAENAHAQIRRVAETHRSADQRHASGAAPADWPRAGKHKGLLCLSQQGSGCARVSTEQNNNIARPKPLPALFILSFIADF